MYGAEIWGIDYQQIIERIHFYACKRYMCARLNSSNDAVLGECGRFPLHIYYQKRCIKFWLKILRMPADRYIKKCYLMLKCFAETSVTNWASKIRNILRSNGFSYTWENQSFANEKHFISMFTQQLKDQHLQNWFERISLSPKLIIYSGFKNAYEHELHLHHITNRKFRRIILNFRISAHDLEIERGRYIGIDRNNRTCKLCLGSIEDEFHLILSSVAYDELRKKYIPVIEHHHYSNSTVS